MPYLSQLSQRDVSFDERKRLSVDLSERYKLLGYDRLSERVAGCADLLGFAAIAAEEGCLSFKLRLSRFCRVRLCPMCQWRRSSKWRGRLIRAVPQILADNPTAKFILLTLTQQNVEPQHLRDELRNINAAWQRLTQRRAFPALGWVKSIEVTRGQNGLAHPHIHCLMMVHGSYFSGRTYVSQKAWSSMWMECLKINYLPIVDVRKIRARKARFGGEYIPAMAAAVCEVLKYEVKETDLSNDLEFLKQVTNQLHKTRAVAIGGIMKQYLREDEPEDLIHDDEVEAECPDCKVEYYFDWQKKSAKYKLQEQ